VGFFAEDGNTYPSPHLRYTVNLAPGKTLDAVFLPKRAGVYPLPDRRLFLTSADVGYGGMLVQLKVDASVQQSALQQSIDNLVQKQFEATVALKAAQNLPEGTAAERRAKEKKLKAINSALKSFRGRLAGLDRKLAKLTAGIPDLEEVLWP